jgi:glycosyltransferase involved in cell wall biosynthesis
VKLNGKRILLRAPLLTQSGYGVHARQIAKWLISKNTNFDCQVLPWGDTPWIIDRNANDGLVGQIMARTKDIQKGYDVTFQLQLPNEWDASLGAFNYGITAGVETDVCNKDWLKCCHKMQHVIVPSTFAKKTFLNSTKIYNEPSLAKKVSVVPESYPDCYDADLEVVKSQYEEKFNFLIVGQITSHNSLIDRKNVLATVKALCEEFRSNEDSGIGIIVKTNSTRNNSIDRALTERVLTEAVSLSRKDFKYPRVHLIHGSMTDEEMQKLYTDTSVKALVTLTRGEGYGLPLLEAASLGIPIIAPADGGYEEFLGDSYTKISGRFVQIPKEKVDNNIFVQAAKWFNPSVEEFKSVCRSFANDNCKQQKEAATLKTKINSCFSERKVFELYDKLVEESYSNRALNAYALFVCRNSCRSRCHSCSRV